MRVPLLPAPLAYQLFFSTLISFQLSLLNQLHFLKALKFPPSLFFRQNALSLVEATAASFSWFCLLLASASYPSFQQKPCSLLLHLGSNLCPANLLHSPASSLSFFFIPAATAASSSSRLFSSVHSRASFSHHLQFTAEFPLFCLFSSLIFSSKSSFLSCSPYSPQDQKEAQHNPLLIWTELAAALHGGARFPASFLPLLPCNPMQPVVGFVHHIMLFIFFFFTGRNRGRFPAEITGFFSLLAGRPLLVREEAA